MENLTEIHRLIDKQLPLPECAPKIYVLGDTGAGKSTVLQHILGTKKQSFPSTLRRRTTVAITEYVIDKTLPYAACFVLKTAIEVRASIEEILEYTQSSIMKLIKKGKEIDRKDVVDNLGESADQRFRLKYIIEEEVLDSYATRLISESETSSDSYEEEVEQAFIKDLAEEVFKVVQVTLKDLAGVTLSDGQATLIKEYDNRETCIDSVKMFLKAGKGSLSPLVSYARVQGRFGAEWLPEDSSFVIIDGEGIGHDIKESAILSSRHLDYFEFSDAIVLAEGAGKPFAAGGKSALKGVIQNGYVDNFYLMMTKLDELIDEDEEEQSDFKGRIQDVRREFKNLDQALKSDDIQEERWSNNVFYTEGLKAKNTPTQSIDQLSALISMIVKRHSQDRAVARMPEYDLEMLSAYLEKVSEEFHEEWKRLLIETPWQSIKAFNRRMVWKHDEYKGLKPIAQLHDFIIAKMYIFLADPKSWPCEISNSEKQESIDTISKLFSSKALAVVRDRIHVLVEELWEKGMQFSGAGSTMQRKKIIEDVWNESVPYYQDIEAIRFKDQIKQSLISAMTV